MFNDQRGGVFHPECWRCGQCNSKLGVSFHWKNNSPVCSNCIGMCQIEIGKMKNKTNQNKKTKTKNETYI